MKKYSLLILCSLSLSFFNIHAQKGARIGYIDMEYILEKMPAFAEANNQLELKAQKWKQEIEEKRNEITKLKESLKTEKVLLTKELIQEREEEIAFHEKELSDYQQKRFGPNGDLISQKAVLIKPIQDQVFNAVQDIAEAKNYDYIFDKSSDLTMLFAKKNLDISDKVVTVLLRAERKEKLTKKQLADEAEKERKEEAASENPQLAERQKKLEEKKEQAQKLAEERKLANEAKKKEFEEKRAKLLEEKAAKKNGTVSATSKTETPNTVANEDKKQNQELKKQELEDKKTAQQEARQKLIDERKQKLEEQKKALEDKKKKILEDREAAKKAREEELKNKTEQKKP